MVFIFVVVLALRETIFVYGKLSAILVSSAYSMYAIVRYSPVENDKKKLYQEQKQKNRLIAVVLSSVAVLVSVTMVVLGNNIGYYISATVLVVCIMIVVCVKGRS